MAPHPLPSLQTRRINCGQNALFTSCQVKSQMGHEIVDKLVGPIWTERLVYFMLSKVTDRAWNCGQNAFTPGLDNFMWRKVANEAFMRLLLHFDLEVLCPTMRRIRVTKLAEMPLHLLYSTVKNSALSTSEIRRHSLEWDSAANSETSELKTNIMSTQISYVLDCRENICNTYQIVGLNPRQSLSKQWDL